MTKMKKNHKKDENLKGKDNEEVGLNRRFIILYLAILVIILPIAISSKNIFIYGFEFFIERLPIVVGYSLIMFILMCAILYAADRFGSRKQKGDDKSKAGLNRRFIILYSAIIAIILPIAVSLKNIFIYGFEFFIERIPILIGYSLIMFILMCAILYAAEKFGPRKRN